MSDEERGDVALTAKQQEFLERYASPCGLNVKKTCAAIGISRTTFYEWMGPAEVDKPNTFRQSIEDEAEGLKDNIEQAMFDKMIDDGNVPLMIHFSKTKMRDRGYGEHTTVVNESAGITHIESEYIDP